MDADIKDVSITIDQLDGLLLSSFHIDLLQAAKLPDAMVNVCHIIAHLQFVKLLKGNGLLLRITVFKMKFVITLKDLMIGITAQL